MESGGENIDDEKQEIVGHDGSNSFATDTEKPSHRDVHNPLKNTSTNSLIDQATVFVDQHGLSEHRSVFERAIILVQNPTNFESTTGNDEELQTLRDEENHKWRLSRSMWMTMVVCSIGAAVQGWDQTGSNGANLSFPAEFGIGSNSAHDKLLVGLINSVPPLAMVCLGCWLSEPLNNRFGRRGAIFISGVFAFCSVLGSALTQSWYQLLACRILLGIGMGIKSSTTAIFAAEAAPAAIRGSLVMGWELWLAFGQFLGLTANLAVVNCGNITWRLQIGSAFIPAVPLLLLIYFCPESPRWYMKQGRVADAFDSLLRLRNHPILAARDLLLLHASLAEEEAIVRRSDNGLTRFCQLFMTPRVRRANLAASVVMIAQQMCGINIIAFYSSTIFTDAEVTPKTALWASFGFGLLGFLSTLPALRVIDTFGRRSLLLATFPHMAWTLLAAGLCFLVPGEGTSRLAGIAVLIYLFTIIYSLGEGPVCYVYASEVFPLSHREVGMAWAVCVNAVGAFVLGLTFPYMLVAFTATGSFAFYCGMNVLAFILIFLWVPETRQYTLEELDFVFSIPTSTFMHHQLTKVLPTWIRRWALWQRNVQVESLKLPDRIVDLHRDGKISV